MPYWTNAPSSMPNPWRARTYVAVSAAVRAMATPSTASITPLSARADRTLHEATTRPSANAKPRGEICALQGEPTPTPKLFAARMSRPSAATTQRARWTMSGASATEFRRWRGPWPTLFAGSGSSVIPAPCKAKEVKSTSPTVHSQPCLELQPSSCELHRQRAIPPGSKGPSPSRIAQPRREHGPRPAAFRRRG